MRMLATILAVVAVTSGCRRSAVVSPPPAPSAPASSAVPAPPPTSCGAAPSRETSVDEVTGKVPAWRVSLGPGTGGLTFDVAESLVVARLQGGRSVSIDAETGALCATLIEGPSGKVPTIDPYTSRSVVMNGALVGGGAQDRADGPSGLSAGAIDIHTGAARWTRQLVGVVGDQPERYALRDGMHGVAAGGVDVIGLRLQHGDISNYRIEEVVIGLDPKTGAEKWRRTAIAHPRGEAVRQEGDMRLATDGERVFVDTPDGLLAFDGKTGAPVWSSPWKRIESSPRKLIEPRRSVLVGEARLVVARDGAPLEVFDARDGKRLRQITIPWRTTKDVLVLPDALIVSVEDAPGKAAVAAVDMAGRVRWKYDAAYSVARIRALDAIWVLEGNGRLSKIDEKTGASRGGMNVGYPFDFAVTKTRAGSVRVIIPRDSLSAFDFADGERPKPLESFLRWRPEVRKSADGTAFCYAHKVVWTDGEERVVWQREVPARMRTLLMGGCDDIEVTDYLRHPRHAFRSIGGLIGGWNTDAAIVIADLAGVLVLRTSDGSTLLDRAPPSPSPLPSPSRGALFFDEGTFALDGPTPCTGRAPRARVLAKCGASLLYFNGSTAMLIDTQSWKVVNEGVLATKPIHASGGTTEATVKLGPRTLTLRGQTFMGD